MINTTLVFWGKGVYVPPRVERRAQAWARKLGGPPQIHYGAIIPTSIPGRYKVEISLPSAGIPGREEGRKKTIDLIGEWMITPERSAANIHFILGDLRGFGKLNAIYGKKITDWLKAETFRIIHQESKRIGFMYTIYGDEIAITTNPGVARAEVDAFIRSLSQALKKELSRYRVAQITEGQQTLEQDPRVKVIGGYFGVDLIVFDAEEKSLEQALGGLDSSACLYDPDFNGAYLWTPATSFAVKSLSELTKNNPEALYQEAMQCANFLLKPKKPMGTEEKLTILNSEGRKQIPEAIQRLRKARKSEELDDQFPVLNRTTLQNLIGEMLKRGKKVLVGKAKISLYRYHDLSFSGFKVMNDRMGSAVGDEVIQLLAFALRDSFPESFSIARMTVPPDEFMFVVDITKKNFSLADFGRFLVAAQKRVRALSEVEVAFEVPLVNSEEAEKLLPTLGKIDRAKTCFIKVSFPSGNTAKLFNPDSADELNREIRGLEREIARLAEIELAKTKT